VNIVEAITNQISGPMWGQISSLTGGGESTARSAVGAAVPTLLSWFSRMASTSEGANKLTSAVERFDPGAPGSLAGMLQEGPEALAEKGSGMLHSLLGSSGLSGVVDSITRSLGLGTGGATRLLGTLTPLVLGGIARHFSGRSVTPDSLTSFFRDQKSNIAQAMPSAVGGARDALKEGYGRVKETGKAMAESVQPAARWLLPAVLGLAALALIFVLYRSRPSGVEQPQILDQTSQLRAELHDVVGSTTDTLRSVTDPASAEAALPKLEAARKTMDEFRSAAAQLPPEARSKFDELLQSGVEGIKEQSERLATLPGVGDKIKPVLDDLMTRFSTPVGGAPADVR
jgi:hypothetical protein